MLSDAAALSSPMNNCNKNKNKKRYVTRWNRHMSQVHRWFNERMNNGKPRGEGPLYFKMTQSRKQFKNKVRWCQNNTDQIKIDIIIASAHKSKDFSKFWKQTKKLAPKSRLPASVNGITAGCDIADMFRGQFVVDPQVQPVQMPSTTESDGGGGQEIVFVSRRQKSDGLLNT